MQQKALSKGHVFKIDEHIPLELCLTTAAHKRHLDYQAVMPRKCALDGSCFYDVEQNENFGSCGGLVPTLVSHGTLVNGRTLTIVGGLSHLAVMGEPVFEHQRDGHPFQCTFQNLLDAGKLSENAMKDLAGNAIHEPTLGMLLMFVLANTSRHDSSGSSGSTRPPRSVDRRAGGDR
jgi:hypothetical protein